MDPYSTHIPVTALALCKTAQLYPDLPILECGCGDYSTPMFELLKGDRQFDIYSSDPSWSDRFTEVADRVIYVKPEQKTKWGEFELEGEYGLCLMDSEELTVYRRQHIPKLLDCCKVVMMHDANLYLMQMGTYNYMYARYSPRTWIGSHHVDVREWFA